MAVQTTRIRNVTAATVASRRMAARRIKVSGRDVWLVLAIAAVAAAGLVAADLSPTGSSALDALVVSVSAVFVVWAAASAPWWAGVVVAGIGAALADSGLMIVVGLAAIGFGLAIGVTRRSVPWSRAVVAGLAVQALSDMHTVGSFGVSAIIGIAACIVLATFGIVRRPRLERKITMITVAALVGVGFLALVGFAVAAASARPDLERGDTEARHAISLLSDGKFDEAQASFAKAADLFRRADDDLGSLWAQPSRLVPGVAQNRNAVTDLVDGAADSVGVVASVLDRVDFDALRVVDGSIDIEAIRNLAQPLEDLNATIDRLDATLTSVRRNPWVVGPLVRRLDDLSEDVADQRVRGADALRVVQQAPAMLGADGKRVYFIAFLTPAEARGSAGFMGNYAELTVDHGHLSVTQFGRHSDLNAAGDPSTRRITVEPEWVARYDGYGIQYDSGIATNEVWSNITMSPDWPATADVIADLYPQSGGQHVDGVIGLDVFAVAKLLDITGPVDVDGLGEPLTSANAARFLLKDQYLLPDKDARIDLLEQAARTTVTRLFTTTLPSPPDLAKLFAPLAAQGHFLGWASRPAEEALFVQAKMSDALGELGEPGVGDAFTFSFVNASASKIDAYLTGDATYVVTPDFAANTVRATATLTLTNTAPSSGLPDYVIGNEVGLPTGTNRTWVSLFTALAPVSMTVDGKEAKFALDPEAGLQAAGKFVDIPSGRTVTIVVQYAGALDLSGGYRLRTRSPALANPMPITVDVLGRAQDGDPSVANNAYVVLP